MGYLTTTEMAEKWQISSRRIAILCEQKRLEGVMKKGKTWLIPEELEKPEDGRYKRVKAYYDKYAELESQYDVVYPENSNATYTSLLNYSDDLSKPYQRWYRYKEGFSVELVEQLINEFATRKKGIILDPFAGSGSTLLAARKNGYSGYGFEVNPFSFYLAKCKLDVYTNEEIEIFKKSYEWLLDEAKNGRDYQLPDLSISSKVFDEIIETYMMSISVLIDELENVPDKVKKLLLLGWLACIEPLCNYRKAGNGLKYKKYAKPRVITVDDAKIMLLEEYQNIYIDLLKEKGTESVDLINDSCLNMKSYIENDTVEGIIFSPPYANCFDYTEIYKLELWFGKFVTSYPDMKKLRKQSLHSHLNGDLSLNTEHSECFIEDFIDDLDVNKLWDKKIPKMLKLYYDDMFTVLDESYRVLKKNGFCCIVVGNSAYGGIVFPADLILSKYAESIGFKVKKIEVDRYIITSSQQYEITKDTRKYLRESVVCLVKE